jgi:outer membrane lipoprotein-sorting protein
MGAALPPMRPINRGLWIALAVLCLAVTGAGPRHLRTSSVSRRRSVGPVYMLVPVKPASPKPHVPTAADLYPKSLHADALYSYRGRQTTTYWHLGRSEAVIIAHRAPNMRRIDYLAPDFERGRSVVTDASQEWQFDPIHHQLLHRRLEPDAEAVADAAESYDLLRQNYIVQVVPQAQNYADRRIFLLTITRKNHLLARKLWIDAATGLVLKRENYHEDGTPALTVAFTDINFHAPLPRSLFDLSALAHRPGVRTVEEPGSAEKPLPLSGVSSQLGGAALTPRALLGYRLVSASLTQNGSASLLHLRYSDGLTLVSLFEQRRTQIKRPTRVPSSMHRKLIGRRDGHVAHRASLTALNWDTDRLNLTLMGELGEPSLVELALAADVGGRR